MAATAQIGTTLKIGFNSYVYSGYIMEGVSLEPTGEQKIIKGEDNETQTILVSDLGTQISFTAIITGTGSLTPPAKGSIVTINTVKYRCESSSVQMSREEARLQFTGIKEASMTYT